MEVDRCNESLKREDEMTSQVKNGASHANGNRLAGETPKNGAGVEAHKSIVNNKINPLKRSLSPPKTEIQLKKPKEVFVNL